MPEDTVRLDCRVFAYHNVAMNNCEGTNFHSCSQFRFWVNYCCWMNIEISFV